MARLWYRTKGNSGPSGKQRVYFSAHPRDHQLLSGIAAELLEHQNCAVWYDREPDAPFDENELAARLSQMQLFVMPVTRRLLTQPSRALDFEFRLAQREHIPVLPLMQEEGLERLFNRRCGDLQFLYKYSRDTTGISYEEKLRSFLDAVLVDDSEAKRIRDAFESYIFLSYRKKDREQAQRLMRLIHNVDACRDAAIWYDEFLTPGENFTNHIKGTLSKSRLFVLAVTPNVLEENNYVMETEYPLAVKKKKPVLPVMMEETDTNRLMEKYENIPQCVDADDSDALRQALSRYFSTDERDNSPEKLYLLGLAYLNGVDVERDNRRAAELITAAADMKYPEALCKIVQMYREGQGVKRDYSTAIEWQRVLVEKNRQLHQQEKTEEAAKTYFNSLWDLGDYVYELRRVDKSRQIYQHMLEVSTDFADRFASPWARRSLSVSCSKLGDICAAAGDNMGAGKYYGRMHDISLSIAGETDTLQARRDVSVSCSKLGDICRAMGDLSGAEKYYRQGLDITAALAEEDDSIQSRRALSLCCERQGDICAAAGNIDLAREYYQKSLDMFLLIAEEDRSIEARRAPSVSYNKLGDICASQKDFDQAREYYQKDYDIALAIARKTDTLRDRRDLSVSCSRLGDVCRAAGDLKSAKKYYQKMLDITEAIARESDTAEARRELSVSYNKLGNVCKAAKDREGARRYYLKGLEIALGIAENDESAGAWDDVAMTYYKLGSADEDNIDREMLQKAYDIWAMLSERYPKEKSFARRCSALEELLF